MIKLKPDHYVYYHKCGEHSTISTIGPDSSERAKSIIIDDLKNCRQCEKEKNGSK